MSEAALERVRSAVCSAILELPEPSLDAVRQRVFPDENTLDATTEAFLRSAHASQLHIALLAHCKEVITGAMISESTTAETLVRYASASETDVFTFLADDPEAQRLLRVFPIDSIEAKNLHQELKAFQRKLARRVQAYDANISFQEALEDWMRSGEPTREMWQALRGWRVEGGGLAAFRKLLQINRFQINRSFDNFRKMLDAVRKMRDAVDFVDREKIQQILDRCCSSTFTLIDGHLRVEGATIAISSVNNDILALLSPSSTSTDPLPHTVSIYAADCCSLDCSIDQSEWSGVNLCIVTRRLFVHESIEIDLSGRPYEQRDEMDRSAANSTIPDRTGSDGASGRAGRSSGNLCLLADELVGGERMSVKLNGGRGEDGQNGGNGCKGADGIGVTKEEIMAIHFPNAETSPDEGQRKALELTYTTKFYEFIDNRGRNVYYSENYVRKLLLIFIQGSIGEAGSSGGVGGAGGEGGYAGTFHVSDFSGSRAWSVGSVSQKRGDQGDNGSHGEWGPSGKDGNDLYKYGPADMSAGETSMPSSENLKYRMSLTTRSAVSSYFLRAIPHMYSAFNLRGNTVGMFATYTPNTVQAIHPEMSCPERVQARAQATLQVSTAMNEFAHLNGVSAEMYQTLTVETQGNKVITKETVEMVRERTISTVSCPLPRSAEGDSDRSDSNEHTTHADSTHWGIGLRWRSSTDYLKRTIQTFDSDFREAQLATLEQNVEFTKELEESMNPPPPGAMYHQSHDTVLHQDHLLRGYTEIVQTALGKDSSYFIRLFNGLIAADGTRSCVVKWRTIADVFCSLAAIGPHCDWKFIALLMRRTAPHELMNSLIHLRLVVSMRRLDLLQAKNLWVALCSVKSSAAKALLILKIHEAEKIDEPLGEDMLLKILVLLRYAEIQKQQLQRLSRLSLTDWMEIAIRQNPTLVDQNNFGSAAYYLEVLIYAGFAVEGRTLRAVLNLWKHSDRLFGEFTHYIVSKELHADAGFLGALLINAAKGDVPAILEMLPWSERTLGDLAPLVRGLRDTENEAILHREQTQQIVVAKCIGPPITENAALLAKFDDALQEKTGKRLRAVQKVAVINALESPQHLLQQVSTGEGKSYIIAAIAAIRCLGDKNATVDVITTSPVLAKRDANMLFGLYHALGLTVAHNCEESREAREIAYKAQVVYGDMAHFQRDYLLHTFYRKNILGTRELVNVIVDEVDSMTLDSGNHVLYLSHKIPSLKLLDSLFAYIQQEVHADIDEESNSTDDIRLRVLREINGRVSKEDIAKIDAVNADRVFISLLEAEIIDYEGFVLVKKNENLKEMLKSVVDVKSTPIIVDALRMEIERVKDISVPFHLQEFVRLHISAFIDNCKLARVMRPNVDYVVGLSEANASSESEVIITIVDVDTGADLVSTQWSEGLHQFLQMKYACRMTPMSLKAVFISNVTFLRKYKRLDGLSGTLGSADESRILAELYKVDLIRIPTHQPRQMVEYVPSLADTSSEWIDSVYRTLTSEVKSGRSVLVICETINQLQQLHQGLASRNEASRSNSVAMDDALSAITIYKRQREKLGFEETPLEPGRIILSTNLAGRGTDILLSKELEDNGGLHVVIAFVPRNKRIEEQAMGRAARDGARGSGQIIAFVRPSSEEIAPSLHEFKIHRDNAELLRLQTLRHNFEFRVAIQEGALERFRRRIDEQLFRDNASHDRLPDTEDVIYRALLDEWTLWLDARDEEIKQCADERDVQRREEEKERIIMSVDAFLDSHPINKQDELFVVPSWLRAGEWLLRVGLIQMHHLEGKADAERTFNRVWEDGSALAPFALYYKACMAMQNLEEMRETQSSVLLETVSGFEADPYKAFRLFAMARVGLREQMERRAVEISAIQQRAGSNSEQCGLQKQLIEMQDAVGQIIANIDWMIGERMTADNFRLLTSNKQQQIHLFESLEKIDVISAPVFGGDLHEHSSVHQGLIRRKFGISQAELARALNNGKTDDCPDHVVMSGGGAVLEQHLALPTRLDFWHDMRANEAFFGLAHVYYVNKESQEEVASMIPVQPMLIDDYTARSGILLSNRSLGGASLYLKSDVDALVLKDEAIAEEVQILLDIGSMELDMYARIDASRLNSSHLLQFDGFTANQMKEHFGLDKTTADWILNQLCSQGVIKLERVPIVKLVGGWRQLAETFLWPSAISPELALERMQSIENAFTISPTILRHAIHSQANLSGEDSSRAAEDLFNSLLEGGLLQRRKLLVYRKAGSINCSMLLSTLADPVHSFLSHHFSYTFARDVLSRACADSEQVPFTIKTVMLPENAHRDLFDELCRLEIVTPPRIASDHYQLIDYTDFPFIERREFEQFIYARRMKLNDEIQMFTLVPFVQILAEKNTFTTREMEALIDMGMAVGVSLKQLSTTEKAAGALMQCARSVHNNRLMWMKCITWAIGLVVARHGIGEIDECLNTNHFGDAALAMVSAIVLQFHHVERELPKQISNDLRKLASASVDAVGRAQKKIQQGFKTRIHHLMSYLCEKCRALFGSSEYYNQCRMATYTITARASPNDTMDEYRLIRMFNNIGAATEEQNRAVNAREQALIDQTLSVAREFKSELISRLLSLSTPSFPGLAEFLNSLEHHRWFESELTLCIQWAEMEAVRALTDTGRVDGFKKDQIKFAAVAAAYSAMSVDCDQELQRRAREEPRDDQKQESLMSFITDEIDFKMTEIFTNPLVNLIRCIISEHSECGISEPHQELIDADIAKAAKQFRKGNPNKWLESLQLENLVSRVHARISVLFQNIEKEEMLKGVVGLTRLCLIQRLPMPYEPCFSILCNASKDIRRTETETTGNIPNESPKRFILLTKADYPRWKIMFNEEESVYLNENVIERAKNIDNAETLRTSLIKSLQQK